MELVQAYIDEQIKEEKLTVDIKDLITKIKQELDAEIGRR